MKKIPHTQYHQESDLQYCKLFLLPYQLIRMVIRYHKLTGFLLLIEKNPQYLGLKDTERWNIAGEKYIVKVWV